MRWLCFLTNGRFSAFDEDVYHLVAAQNLEIEIVERQALEVELTEGEVLEFDLVERMVLECEVKTCSS